MVKIYDSNPNPPSYVHSDAPFAGNPVKSSVLNKLDKVNQVLQKIQPFLLVFVILLLLFLVQLAAETRTNVKKILDDEVITVKDQSGNTVVVPLKYKGVLRTSESQN